MYFAVSLWNFNGRTTENNLLREKLIPLVDSEIYCLNERHLDKDNNLECEGYITYLNNMQTIHTNTPKWSGGGEVLVKRYLFDYFKV